MAQRVLIRIDVGPAVPLDLVSQLIQSVSTVCNVALQLQLSAGVHFMQVPKWLGHSTFTPTLDVYGDDIAEEDGSATNTLPEPPGLAKTAETDQHGATIRLSGRRVNVAASVISCVAAPCAPPPLLRSVVM